MAAPVKIEKSIRMNKFEIVKFQLMTHCFIENIRLNETELNLLSFLGTQGKVQLKNFCKSAVERGYFGHATAAHNCLWRMEKTGLYVKEGTGSKCVYLNPKLDILSDGIIILDYKIVKLESEKIPGNTVGNSQGVPA